MAWRRGRAYSDDLRRRVLAAEGSARAVSARFGVSISYVVKARQRQVRTGEHTARPQRSHSQQRLAGLHQAIAVHVQQHPDLTLHELRTWLREAHHMTVSLGLMWNTLARLGLTLKKSRCTPPNRLGPILPTPAANGASCSPLCGPSG